MMAKKNIQRIMIDGGFTCPNRDGKISRGGCTYCRNDAFAPEYCRKHSSIREQIEAGKEFFKGKYETMEYDAYFQSYSGTYADIATLQQRYNEALSVKDVTGLVIGTRPDCLGEDILNLLDTYNTRTRLEVEIGVESCTDRVLRRINRGHDFACAEDAIRRTASRGIRVGVHIILGLPGETFEEMLHGADILSSLPVNAIKLHQLQIQHGTAMAEDYRLHPKDYHIFSTAEEYASLAVEFASRLRPDIKIGRIVSECPPDMLIAPRWGLKPSVIQKMFESKLREKTLKGGNTA